MLHTPRMVLHREPPFLMTKQNGNLAGTLGRAADCRLDASRAANWQASAVSGRRFFSAPEMDAAMGAMLASTSEMLRLAVRQHRLEQALSSLGRSTADVVGRPDPAAGARLGTS